MTRLAGAIAGLAVVSACSRQPGSPSGQSTTTSAQRSTVDRTDDTPGSQVHVMYVLPSDGADQNFDTDGTISSAMTLAQNWFATQTNNRHVRYDTYQAALDITFVRLARTDAQYLSFGVTIRGAVQADLEAVGFNDPRKIYAVFYGGGSPRTGVQIPCAQGGSPGTMGAVYLACLLDRSDIQGLIPVHGLAKILGIGMIHEVFHNLGAVPACAPHSSSSHSTDDPRDIMVSSLSSQLSTYRDAGFLPVLDAGRDDYYEHAIPGCVDIAKSPFLEETL